MSVSYTHLGGVGLAQEARGVGVVVGANDFSVVRAVTGDVIQRVIQRIHDADRKDQVMELLPEVAGLRGNGLRSGQQGQGAGVGPELHAVGTEFHDLILADVYKRQVRTRRLEARRIKTHQRQFVAHACRMDECRHPGLSRTRFAPEQDRTAPVPLSLIHILLSMNAV